MAAQLILFSTAFLQRILSHKLDTTTTRRVGGVGRGNNCVYIYTALVHGSWVSILDIFVGFVINFETFNGVKSASLHTRGELMIGRIIMYNDQHANMYRIIYLQTRCDDGGGVTMELVSDNMELM